MSAEDRNKVTHYAQQYKGTVANVYQRLEDGTYVTWTDDESPRPTQGTGYQYSSNLELPKGVDWKKNPLYQPPTE